MISESLERAKRSFRCAFCERIVPSGEEHVQQEFEGEDETHTVQLICQACAATTEAAGTFDEESCVAGMDVREEARNAGWKKIRQAWRSLRERLAGKPEGGASQPVPEVKP
jgi:hypothetical protein